MLQLFSWLLVCSALGGWVSDRTLEKVATVLVTDLEEERCLLHAGRFEAGERNIVAAAKKRRLNPEAALLVWEDLFTPKKVCRHDGLSFVVDRERHPHDHGVNWVMRWQKSGS